MFDSLTEGVGIGKKRWFGGGYRVCAYARKSQAVVRKMQKDCSFFTDATVSAKTLEQA